MSQAVEDLVRLGYDRFNEGGREVSELWHVDGEYINAHGDPEPAIHRGFDAIARVFRTWFEALSRSARRAA